MELPNLLQLETDCAVVLQFAQERGPEAARLVARNLDASQSDFWKFLPDFLDQWGLDAEVVSGILQSIAAIRDVYSDKAEILKPRLEVLKKLQTHQNPLVQDMAYQAKEALLRDIKDWS